MALIEVRLRPTGPWRVGHHAGDRERVDVVYHSDALYSAITHAMRALGWLDEWLASPVARFSSLFPFIGKTRLIAPPRTSWPPANPGKLYLLGSRLVPLEVARNGVVDESRWSVDGGAECLVPAGAGAPFHVSMRSAAAVDRVTGATEPHRVACLEFASNAGWWGVFEASDKVWEGRVKSAFRLLADSGFGGERSRGWGRAGSPEFSDASGLFPREAANGMWWLLSLYSPAEQDTVDWSKSEYTAATRGGWTDSPAGAGAKKQLRMIEEGSVLAAESLQGRTVNVAPEGFPHPVYRSGIALAVPLPVPERAPQPQPLASDTTPDERQVGQAVPPVHENEAVAPPPAEQPPSDVAQATPPVQEAEPVEALPPDTTPDEQPVGQAVPPVHENEAVAPPPAEQSPSGAPQATPPAQEAEPVEALPPDTTPDEQPVGQALPPVHENKAVAPPPAEQPPSDVAQVFPPVQEAEPLANPEAEQTPPPDTTPDEQQVGQALPPVHDGEPVESAPAPGEPAPGSDTPASSSEEAVPEDATDEAPQ